MVPETQAVALYQSDENKKTIEQLSNGRKELQASIEIERSSLEKQLTELKEEISTLLLQRTTSTTETEDMTKRLSASEAALQQEIKKYESVIADLQASLQERMEEIELMRSLSQDRTELEALNTSLATSVADNERLKNELEKLSKSSPDKEKELQEKITALAGIKLYQILLIHIVDHKSVSSNSGKASSLEEIVEQLRQQVSQIEQELTNTSYQVAEKNTLIEEQDITIESLQHENMTYAEKLAKGFKEEQSKCKLAKLLTYKLPLKIQR
jgi:chromosome segregation ATPase